jgi:LPS export ABC transporter protein LptC
MRTRLSLGTIILIAGVVLVVVALIVGLAHRQAPPSPNAAAPAATGTRPQDLLKGNLSLQGTQMTKRDAAGNPVWSLQAGSEIKVDSATKTAQGENAHWFLQNGASSEWQVEAPEVLYRLDSGQVEFTGGVKCYSTDGKQRFHAQRLVYDPATKELRGQGPVELDSGKSRVTSDQIVIATDKHVARLIGAVHFRLAK